MLVDSFAESFVCMVLFVELLLLLMACNRHTSLGHNCDLCCVICTLQLSKHQGKEKKRKKRKGKERKGKERKGKEKKRKEKKRKEKITPLGVNSMRSQVLYWAAQVLPLIPYSKGFCSKLLPIIVTVRVHVCPELIIQSPADHTVISGSCSPQLII